MTITGDYVPSPIKWVRDQVEKIEETGTTRSVQILDRPVVMLTMLGVSGKVRKVPLMRVEHEGLYAAVASKGGMTREGLDVLDRPDGLAALIAETLRAARDRGADLAALSNG